MLRKLLVCCIVFIFTVVCLAGKDNYPQLDIKNDENLMFIPSYCYYDKKTNTFHIRFHAWVYEPEASSKKRKLLIAGLAKMLDLDEKQLSGELFEKRVQYLLYDNERNKWVAAGYGGDQYNLGVTDGTGHTERELVLPPEIFQRGLPEGVNVNDFKKKPGWIMFRAGTTHNKERIFEGKAQYIPSDGVIIVSDIDDTIKISGVSDRKILLENTFIKPYVPVEGMADLYGSWESDGASFVYVSASPWQLYEPLTQFLREQSFPEGIMEMKMFDMPSGVKTIFDSPEKVKIPALKKLIKSFPGKKFILIGDSGEQDPEIYGKIADEFKGQIAWILIRNVNGETADSKRMNDALKDFPRERFRLFSEAYEVGFIDVTDIN